MSNRAVGEPRDVILDSINEGVFTVDSQWRITSFNRAAEHITGVRRQEAVGRPCCEVFRASICENACALKQTLSTGRPVVNATAYIVSAAGERVPIRISTALLKDGQGTVIGGVETFQDLSQVAHLQKKLQAKYTFEDIVGRSPAMMRLFEILPRIADSSTTVLIEGPSGTGKELFARAIHSLSPRSRKPFVAINCGALPDTLLESELFGYKAGAFTDAKRDKPGRFALANGGTIFLDEIGDVSAAMQVRLLRVLQERQIEPLGSVQSVKIDVRVIAASNKNLTELVHRGAFREDLFYRISVLRLSLPALRERREDIPLLINHIITRFNGLHGKEIAGVSPEAMSRLMEHDYPGNIRELENIIERAFVLCPGGLIGLPNLPPELRGPDAVAPETKTPVTLEAMEQALIVDALRRHKGNRKLAAKDLGINVSTLFRKIKSGRIVPPSFEA